MYTATYSDLIPLYEFSIAPASILSDKIFGYRQKISREESCAGFTIYDFTWIQVLCDKIDYDIFPCSTDLTKVLHGEYLRLFGIH